MRPVVLVCLLGCGGSEAPPLSETRVLAFTRTLGFRHADAIEAGTSVLAERVTLEATEDPLVFRCDNLARYDMILFLCTSGNDLLDAEGRAAFEAYMRGGGGWMGIHSASDTEYEWPFYQELVLASFESHPAIQPGAIVLEDAAHPATAHLPSPWVAEDEWYNFTVNPRGDGVEVLATIDETSYEGGTMGADHPMVWAHERTGGRALYSQLGHSGTRWSEPDYVDHVLGAIRWVSRRD